MLWHPRFVGCAVRWRPRVGGRAKSEAHVQLTISWDDDPAAAIERVRPVVTYQLRRAPASWREETPSLLRDEVAAIRGAKSFGRSPSAGEGGLASDALVRHAAIVGRVEECRERVREIVALGPEEVTFRSACGESDGDVEGVGGGGVGGVRGPGWAEARRERASPRFLAEPRNDR